MPRRNHIRRKTPAKVKPSVRIIQFYDLDDGERGDINVLPGTTTDAEVDEVVASLVDTNWRLAMDEIIEVISVADLREKYRHDR